MSCLVYFDTNVFDNLIKRAGGVTDADEAALQDAVSSGRLTIIASHVNVRETLAAFRRRPEIGRDQLRLILSLSDGDRFVRLSTELLENDIRHFAFNGEKANTPFEGNRNASDIRSTLQRLIDGRIGPEELEGTIGEDQNHKAEFFAMVKQSKAEIAQELEKIRMDDGIPTFDEFFEENAVEYARAFVDTFDVAELCKQRGLDKLMKIPSIRALIGVSMSFMYRINADKKSFKGSATRDIQHAVCAAAAGADVFVTHDDELFVIFDRVPIRGLRVMTLRQLLDELSLTKNEDENGN